MVKFEVGKTYIVYATHQDMRFRAKCVSRTPKTAKFEASERGGYWYMPTFTLRTTNKDHYVTAEGEDLEVMVSRRPNGHVLKGVFAFANDLATTPLP